MGRHKDTKGEVAFGLETIERKWDFEVPWP